ncbi:hypothetical protein [Longimicrobium sp.]|uniref:hypothetical protein n=1 Tax=Longimicrobium sp. TaxID=2029185 RepID=UPI002E33C97B|nr:hypothetical protein [Longimicrobium sp.]HEX6036716.1 hypothetical protein [Longimicrobium sp.]
MIRRLLIAGILLAVARPVVAQEQAFDPLPLISSASLDSSAIQRERQDLVNWMKTASGASHDELLATRERLYFVIGSAARQDFFAQLGQNPQFDPADLAQLFELAASLGVYGAADIARSLPLSPEDAIGAAPGVPAGMRLEFAPPLLRVSSDSGGWTAQVPYYWMIGSLQRAEVNGGPTELASISTLFGDNKNQEGASQATILLVSAPGQDPAAFEEFWLAQVGVTRENVLAESPLAGATAYRARDDAADLSKEVVFIRTARGPLAVAYVGLSGPFETNRVNFVDFLRNLRLP